jgi:hypothetical protein
MCTVVIYNVFTVGPILMAFNILTWSYNGIARSNLAWDWIDSLWVVLQVILLVHAEHLSDTLMIIYDVEASAADAVKVQVRLSCWSLKFQHSDTTRFIVFVLLCFSFGYFLFTCT